MEEKNSTLMNIASINIEEEIKTSYMSYAMSVIVGRALPDIRDGLKPVHRRILFAMHEENNIHSRPYKKSARIVGNVIGKYHPHGDTAVYDSIVRMAQTFSLRYTLVEGQGNFGSIDGDAPAAMRYTEIRMERITSEMLKDLEKETVDWALNYDESLKEPTVLPARIPNLLINGSSGIAVGMATNIPPHNLNEIMDALIFLIDDKDTLPEDLMKIVKGPDFPTGGYIYDSAGLKNAYLSGRGIITMRGHAEVEELKSGKNNIIITEIPYQVNKAKLVERIAELIKDKKIEGISDLRDESDKDGMRIVIECKKDVNPHPIINNLYKYTPLQGSFGIIFLSIVNNMPQVLGLKDILQHFIAYRKEIVTRRTIFDLNKAKDRLHILEGLKKALDHLDEIIALIRKSEDPKIAKENLISRFDFSDRQAQAILDMRLQRLTGLERDKIIAEYNELLKTIEYLMRILSDEPFMFSIIREEFLEIKERYGDERKTKLLFDSASLDFNMEDLIEDEEVVITISQTGYIKRDDMKNYISQRRGGKGKTGMATKEEDFVRHVFVASTHSYLLIFSNLGRVYWLKVYEIPDASGSAKGKPIVNLVQFTPDEKIAAILPVRTFEDNKFIIMATKKGIIKKTSMKEFSNIRSSGKIAITIDEDDALIAADVVSANMDIVLSSSNGMSIRFNQNKIRGMGRTARGVIGIRFKHMEDTLVSLETVNSAIISPEGTGEPVEGELDQELILEKQGEEAALEEELPEEMDETEEETQSDDEEGLDSTDSVAASENPTPTDKEGETGTYLLAITEKGYGKRTRTEEFRLTNRGGKGIITIKTSERNGPVRSVILVEKNDEVFIMTNSGKIIRLTMEHIPIISRNTQGVKLISLSEGEKVIDTALIKGDIDKQVE